MIMLLLDFCNIQEWSVEKLSGLYDKYRIIHAPMSLEYSSEPYCKTKHKEECRYYFVEDILKDLDLIGHKHYISPGRPEYDELWKMLEKSQFEYRSFLDECIKGKLNIEYINTLSEEVSICFTNNPQNIFLPYYSFNLPEINDIESCVELDILNISLNRAGPWIEDMEILNINLRKGESSLIGRIRKCPNCNKHFIFYKKPTRKYCDDTCKNAYHNEKEGAKAKQKKKIYEERAKGRYQ